MGYAATLPTMVNYPVGTGYYTVTVNLVAAAPGVPAGYTILATPVGDQANDLQCTSFTLSSTGQQTATGGATASVQCWK